MKRILVLLLTLTLILTAGCSASAPRDSAPVSTPSVNVSQSPELPSPSEEPDVSVDLPSATDDDAPEKISVSVETSGETYYAADGETILFNTEFHYPIVTILGREDVSAKINSAVRTGSYLTEEQTEEYISWAAEERELEVEAGSDFWMNFFLYTSVEAQRIDSSIISLVTTSSSYFGGVHPNSASFTQNFDTVTGEEVFLADLSSDENALREFLLNYLDSLIKEDDYWFYEDYIDYLPMAIADNFWHFSNEGLVIICDTYLIAPYAAGIIRFTVPYSELNGLIYDKWLPTETADPTGVAEITVADSSSEGYPNSELFTDNVVYGAGSEFQLLTSTMITDVRLYSAVLLDDGSYMDIDLLYAANRLTASDVLCVFSTLSSTEIMTFSYTDASGAQRIIISGDSAGAPQIEKSMG